MDSRPFWRVVRFAALRARLQGRSAATVTAQFRVVLDDEDAIGLGVPRGLLRACCHWRQSAGARE